MFLPQYVWLKHILLHSFVSLISNDNTGNNINNISKYNLVNKGKLLALFYEETEAKRS